MPAKSRSVAMIDIGSNSIRLVIFDVSAGYPHPLYNERVFCALGTDVGTTGRLPRDSIDAALAAVVRFVEVARRSGTGHLKAFATSAVRDAENGRALASAIRARTGCEVDVIDGGDEARLSAKGVLHGLHARDGIVADLGGGSLELARLRDGEVCEAVSVPIGTMRLMAKTSGDLGDMSREVASRLDELNWLGSCPRRTLYPIGGAWRAFARLRIAESGYPLKIIHGYTVPTHTARETAQLLAGLSERSLARMADVAAKRRPTMPLTGLIMRELIDRMRPGEVTFSATGIREGYVYACLPEDAVARDPLIAGADALAARENHSGDATNALIEWMAPLLPTEKPARERLQRTVCALSNMAWREHPDYRASYAFERSIQYPFLGVAHEDRAFIGLSLYIRYGGKLEDVRVAPYLELLSKRAVRRAAVLGHALRLGYLISGGSPELLRQASLEVHKGEISMRLPGNGAAPDPGRVEREFERLCVAQRQRAGAVTIESCDLS